MAEKRYDLVTLGEILLRLSPMGCERISDSDTFKKDIGGAELNVASGAAQLGLEVGMLSKIPDSGLGDFVRRQVRAHMVSDALIQKDESPEARLGIYYYEQGAAPRKPRVIYDRKDSSVRRLSVDEMPEAVFAETGCFHTSGITLALGGEVRETAIALMKRFKEAGSLISFDVNFRGNLWSGEEARACIEEILPLVDIFFCSKDTAALTFHREGDLKEVLKSFAEDYDLKVVAATRRTVHSPKCHTFTSLIYDAGEDAFFEEKPYENIEVVDRIGSGDAFVAGALYGLLCEDGDCRKALRYGNACSAAKNTVAGDLPSLNREETDDIIADHNSTGYVSEMKR